MLLNVVSAVDLVRHGVHLRLQCSLGVLRSRGSSVNLRSPAAVLGGGSDALHQLVLVFTNFFERAGGQELP